MLTQDKIFMIKNLDKRVHNTDLEELKKETNRLIGITREIRFHMLDTARHTPSDSDCYEAFTSHIIDSLEDSLNMIDNYIKIVSSYDNLVTDEEEALYKDKRNHI